MEFVGNKYTQINDLNNLKHKTSQFKQGYTKLITFGDQNNNKYNLKNKYCRDVDITLHKIIS
jgi:hypothetical protein